MEEKKKYVCKLPTNSYQPGDIVMLSDAEVANYNGGEPLPRFELVVEEVSKEAAAPAEAQTPEVTPEGGYTEESAQTEPTTEAQTPEVTPEATQETTPTTEQGV